MFVNFLKYEYDYMYYLLVFDLSIFLYSVYLGNIFYYFDRMGV